MTSDNGLRSAVVRAFEDGDVDVAVVAFGTLGDQEQLWQDQAAAVASAQTNFTAPMSVGVLLGQHMKRQGHGTIIALSSVAGQRVRRSNFVYGASKAGLDAWLRPIRPEAEQAGVRITVVELPLVATAMAAPTFGDRPRGALTPAQAAARVLRGLGRRARQAHPRRTSG